jgi:hypothetical protein
MCVTEPLSKPRLPGVVCLSLELYGLYSHAQVALPPLSAKLHLSSSPLSFFNSSFFLSPPLRQPRFVSGSRRSAAAGGDGPHL